MGGFKIEDNFEDSWTDVREYVSSLQDKIGDEKTIKSCLKDIGKQIQKCVKQYAPKPSKNPSYSDAGKANYKHIVEDIKYSVKKSRTTGQHYVTIHGGKWTGYKWLWVNDGHFTQSGTWVPGTHFVDKAERASEDAINEIVDRYIKEALGDK